MEVAKPRAAGFRLPFVDFGSVERVPLLQLPGGGGTEEGESPDRVLRREGTKFLSFAVLFLALAGCVLQSAWGGNSTNSNANHGATGTPAGSYTITITGTATGTQHTATANLTVQGTGKNTREKESVTRDQEALDRAPTHIGIAGDLYLPICRRKSGTHEPNFFPRVTGTPPGPPSCAKSL